MNLTYEKFRCKRIHSVGASALEREREYGLHTAEERIKKMEKKFKTVDLNEDINFDDTPPITFQQVTIPNFKLVGTFRLKELLQALGIRKAFEKDIADFGGMSDTSKDLFVSIVRQKVFLEIDEEGTTAAAGDGCMVNKLGGYYSKEPPKLFICNRPFIFFLRENQTGVVLFIGRVLNPLVNG
jgi:serine protease inhibitor